MVQPGFQKDFFIMATLQKNGGKLFRAEDRISKVNEDLDQDEIVAAVGAG